MDLFTPLDADGAWFIERVPIDGCAAKIAEWKSLLADGWRLTVLMDYARAELVAFGIRLPRNGDERTTARLRS